MEPALVVGPLALHPTSPSSFVSGAGRGRSTGGCLRFLVLVNCLTFHLHLGTLNACLTPQLLSADPAQPIAALARGLAQPTGRLRGSVPWRRSHLHYLWLFVFLRLLFYLLGLRLCLCLSFALLHWFFFGSCSNQHRPRPGIFLNSVLQRLPFCLRHHLLPRLDTDDVLHHLVRVRR
jgi:hypothetical protein